MSHHQGDYKAANCHQNHRGAIEVHRLPSASEVGSNRVGKTERASWCDYFGKYDPILGSLNDASANR